MSIFIRFEVILIFLLKLSCNFSFQIYFINFIICMLLIIILSNYTCNILWYNKHVFFIDLTYVIVLDFQAYRNHRSDFQIIPQVKKEARSPLVPCGPGTVNVFLSLLLKMTIQITTLISKQQKSCTIPVWLRCCCLHYK